MVYANLSFCQHGSGKQERIGIWSLPIEPGFPISTRSELTSFLFGLDTNDIRITSDYQACLKPLRQPIASREFSSGTPKDLFSNPEVALYPKKDDTSPIFFIRLPLCALSVRARSQA